MRRVRSCSQLLGNVAREGLLGLVVDRVPDPRRTDDAKALPPPIHTEHQWYSAPAQRSVLLAYHVLIALVEAGVVGNDDVGDVGVDHVMHCGVVGNQVAAYHLCVLDTAVYHHVQSCDRQQERELVAHSRRALEFIPLKYDGKGLSIGVDVDVDVDVDDEDEEVEVTEEVDALLVAVTAAGGGDEALLAAGT